MKGVLKRYQEEKNESKIPFLLNLFLPFKVESFVQGDYITDDSVLVFSLLGTILLGIGIILNTNKTQLPGSLLVEARTSIVVALHVTSLIMLIYKCKLA
ncbi:P13 family porin [Borreliella afzelii]|uniref:P13 family porin n=1 Tax=Borreliella afzelii TaxID=29518 RepID=UPI003BF605D8